MEYIVFHYEIEPRNDAALWEDIKNYVDDYGSRWFLVLCNYEDLVRRLFLKHGAKITKIRTGNTDC